ncbi:MAG: hypothetical protein V1707_03530 [bacterium]
MKSIIILLFATTIFSQTFSVEITGEISAVKYPNFSEALSTTPDNRGERWFLCTALETLKTYDSTREFIDFSRKVNTARDRWKHLNKLTEAIANYFTPYYFSIYLNGAISEMFLVYKDVQSVPREGVELCVMSPEMSDCLGGYNCQTQRTFVAGANWSLDALALVLFHEYGHAYYHRQRGYLELNEQERILEEIELMELDEQLLGAMTANQLPAELDKIVSRFDAAEKAGQILPEITVKEIISLTGLLKTDTWGALSMKTLGSCLIWGVVKRQLAKQNVTKEEMIEIYKRFESKSF